jgi:hypothetical protein
MWVLLGWAGATAIGVAAAGWLTRAGAPHLDRQPWLLYDTSKQHVTILGGLAGFAVTGIVLIASLTRSTPDIDRGSLSAVVVMFVVAYFFYVGNAFLVSYVPHKDTSGDLLPRIHFSLVSTIEYRTLFVSWFALMPLFRTYGLTQPAEVLTILLPLSLLLGSVIIAMAVDGLGLVAVKETYASLAVATLLALLFAGFVRLAGPSFRSQDPALWLAMVIFVVNGAGFALAAATPLAARYPQLGDFYKRAGRIIVLVDVQVTMSALAFLWLSVVGAV